MPVSYAKLCPEFARRLQSFEQSLAQHGLQMRVTMAYRSLAEQANLYAKGRTAPGRIVTNAKPGSSAHNYGLAADFCFTAGKPYDGHNAEWQQFGKLAEQAGLEWAGSWQKFVELCHVQMPGWKTLKKWNG